MRSKSSEASLRSISINNKPNLEVHDSHAVNVGKDLWRQLKRISIPISDSMKVGKLHSTLV